MDKRSLQDLILDLANDGAEFRCRSYSGRGMCGKECLAVVCDDPLLALQVISYEAGSEGIHMPTNIRQDSMGTQYVVYWPGEPFNGA